LLVSLLPFFDLANPSLLIIFLAALLTENNTIGDQKTERKIREKLTKI
jgi:hypothetical protein